MADHQHVALLHGGQILNFTADLEYADMPFRTFQLHDVPGGIDVLDHRRDFDHVCGDPGGLLAGTDNLNRFFIQGSGWDSPLADEDGGRLIHRRGDRIARLDLIEILDLVAQGDLDLAAVLATQGDGPIGASDRGYRRLELDDFGHDGGGLRRVGRLRAG